MAADRQGVFAAVQAAVLPRTLFTKRQLIDDIWDLDSDVDEHTVEVYISRLREKFRDNPDFELRTIRGFGYMGMPREDEHAQN